MFSIFRTKKRFIILGIVVFAVLLAGFLLLGRKNNHATDYVVPRESLVNTLQVDGTYSVAAQTEVNSPTNGIIDQLFVTNTAVVAKGDPLFHVQSTATEGEIRTAYAAYLTAKATLDADKATLYSLQSTMFSKWKIYFDLATNSTYENSDKTPKTES